MSKAIGGLFLKLEPPVADPLPRGTPWQAVIFARVVTYLAWGVGTGLAGALSVGIPVALWLLFAY